ncbi:MAG TPA: iron ABC transporter permease [Acetobacteraceae bacterium]|nr:iron ABC transporter permease [Acetobacteraceae bacterium]
MSGSTLSLPAAPAGTVPSRWRIARERLGDPAVIIMAMAAAILLFLVLYPVFWLFYGSFSYGEQGFGAALAQLWQLPGLARAVNNTLWLVAGTVPLAFVFALPLVWITARTDTPLKGAIEVAALIPFITPPLIGAVAWSLLAAPRTGVINVFARTLGATAPVLNIYTIGGLIFVMSLYLSPYVFLTVKAVMSRMDASLEDASLICGAGVGKTIWYVLIPLSLPAILSAGILVLTRALEEFAIPGVLGAPSGIYTVTTYIYYQAVTYIPPRYEVAALLATALMGVTAFCLGLQAWLLGGGRRFTTVSGKGHTPRLTRLGRWRYVALAYAIAYIALTVVLPYLVLVYASFISQWGRPPTLANLTFANVAATFDPVLPVRQGLANSLLLGFTGATAAALLTLIAGYIITSGRSWIRHALDFVSAIPLAMPGPVMAVAVLWAYLNPPFVLYGTLWILLIAYVTHYLPFGVRTITGSFRQVSVEFERAAAVCGAGRVTGFRDILFPLVLRGVLAGWLLMFVSMIRELSSSIFLYVPGNETVAVTMLEMWQEARFSNVAVLALALVGIALIVVTLAQRLSGSAYLGGD